MGDTASTLAQRKSALRQSLRDARRALPKAARRIAASKAAAHLARACARRPARFVAVYLSFGAEIDTQPLIAQLRRQGCALFVPKVRADGSLRFTHFPAGAVLVRNRYAIAEPAHGARPPRLDLIVVPLVAFDAQGRRLGMGGGYYDRLLARTRARRVGFAYALQEVRGVPVAPHDVPLDAVVTERGYRRLR